MLSAFLRVGLFAFALPSLSVLTATEIHLSPAGNDANPGTPAQPVATPQRAQELVRGLIAAGLTAPVEIIFADGTWRLDAPLELRPEDSGTADFPITWKAADGATPILSGGKPITGTWTATDDGIWHVDVPGTGLDEGQWNFRQVFVNGSRATRARFPNAGLDDPFLYTTGGHFDHAIIDPARIKPAWATAADAQINIVPRSRFFNQWNTVTAVNPETGRIDIADSERHREIDAGSWFWIEGVREELDVPGEWFLDVENQRLHYMPEPGVDPNTLEFIAPHLNRIVNAKGDVDAGTHVSHVHFDGLHFRHTTFTLGHIEARVHTDTAIMFENTLDSSVKNCHFENIGGYALWLHLDSQRNHFHRNSVRQSGGGGVLLTGSRLGYMDDSKIYTPGEAAARVAPILNEITRNTVEHCGRIRYYGGGVHLDSRPFSMTMEPGNRIAHNHFNDLSRNGVFAFRNQGGNVVEYNHIHNAMQTTIDGGCIHFATMNTINAPNYILNNWLYDAWGNERKPDGTIHRRLGNGIFLDWDTSNTTVKDNWVYNSVGGAVKVIWSNRNVVNTGNKNSDTPITPPFVDDVGPDGTATHGIDLANNRLTGSIIHYTQGEHFKTTGSWKQSTATGMWGLFSYNYLVGTAAEPSEATYTLAIPEDGTYEIYLLYQPRPNQASNVPVTITHADGTAEVTWNMRQGNHKGFAVQVGAWRFKQDGANTVTLSTAGTNGNVIADGLGFAKVADNLPPAAANVTITGKAMTGSMLTGTHDYSDPENDPEGASRFQWFRSSRAEFDDSAQAIADATRRIYVVQPEDAGKHLILEVTPVASSGITTGPPARSAATPPVVANDAPVATDVSISGTAAVGAPLAATYSYRDAESDPEGASLLRWYRSDDPVPGPNATVVAGVVDVTPVAWKQSNAFNSRRLAANLSNAAGMDATGTMLHNLDGSETGEPTSADGVSWTTSSAGNLPAAAASGRVWVVADLGATYPLDSIRIWNWQWNHNGNDLANRGVSRFDLLVRDSPADTEDGTPGGAPINPGKTSGGSLDNDAVFNPGSSNPWLLALADQALARAPNHDSHRGETFHLAGQSARFVAIRPSRHFGGSGIGLGKVRIAAGQPLPTYTPSADDAGKYLIFEVIPVATSGNPAGKPATTVIGPIQPASGPHGTSNE